MQCNIECVTDLTETVWGGMHRIDLAQDRKWWSVLENTVLNLWVP
jgi:hypothetical protein